MSLSISFSIGLLVLVLIAGAVGAFVHWATTKAGWPGWVCDWLMLASALLIFAAFKV